MKTALITGITGQDGAYLAQLLLSHDYHIIGIIHNKRKLHTEKLDYLGITSDIVFEHCDLLNVDAISVLLKKHRPHEIYNLAAYSSVGHSYDIPIETLNFNIISVASLLESIRITDQSIKFYQASSSEMFGSVNQLPLKETSVFHPVSPYGISKASAHWITMNYRESYGIFTTSGILFNHESVLRDDTFVIKKVIKQALSIKNGKAKVLEVGNIDVKRDFGYAPKYVEAIYLMMQHETPDDYIIASGVPLSIREIIYYIFDALDISKEKIIINKKFFRANEIKNIYGDPSKAKRKLGWEYNISFFDIVDMLIKEEIQTEKINIATFQR